MSTMQADIILKNFTNYNSKTSKISKIRNYYNNYLGLNNDSNHLYTIDISERDKFIKHFKRAWNNLRHTLQKPPYSFFIQ